VPIAVFDIDGTLTDTMEVDNECYETAIRSELGVEIPLDWETLPEITDSAILAAACRLQGHPAPDPSIEARIAGRVGVLLSRALAEKPERFRPVRGAVEIFARLRASGWKTAMATGSWRDSALVKLKGAGIPYRHVPLATASDRPARRDILALAIGMACSEGDPGSVVYFGDGVWDGRAARSVGCSFIGVGIGKRASALLSVGARAVVPDFSDSDTILDHLEEIRRGQGS
jgi:phosphoglycolate phosphatase-like HAD superfamily hydrolase